MAAAAGKPGRSGGGPGPMRRLRAWGADHGRAAVGALGRLTRSRVASAMTAGVLGVALALPGAFVLLLDNLERHAGTWDDGAQISLFLVDGTPASAQDDLAGSLAERALVRRTRTVTPAEALEEFRATSGMEEPLALLEDNPLPPLIIVYPVDGADPAALERFTAELRGHERVARARLDLQWVERLQAIMALARRAAWLVATLLGGAVILVVGNTIRLAIENRREEIVVTKLIGGTDAFVRRPFLYEGAWYGLIGGVLGAVLVEGGRLVLAGPLERLATLYASGPMVTGLGVSGVGLMTGAGVALGLCGSWLAVGRHLASIEPR